MIYYWGGSVNNVRRLVHTRASAVSTCCEMPTPTYAGLTRNFRANLRYDHVFLEPHAYSRISLLRAWGFGFTRQSCGYDGTQAEHVPRGHAPSTQNQKPNVCRAHFEATPQACLIVSEERDLLILQKRVQGRH